MSFLLNLFLLSPFPACWASCHFPCSGFPLLSAFTVWVFCCALPLPHGGQARVASARLHPGHGTAKIWNGGPVLQLDYSSEFHSKNKGQYTLEVWEWTDPQRRVCRAHHAKCWAGWITSWNQDCQKKYHSNDRKWRGALDESEREWKSCLETQHSKTKIMAIDPITSWQIDVGKKWKQWQVLFSWAPKSLWTVTVDSDCSNEIKRCLLLGIKAVTNLDSIFKCKYITLLTKTHVVNDMVFPVFIVRGGT